MKKFFTIIGGMGTMATESYIHQLNLRTPAHKDQDYLNYILVNHATVPDRSDYILDNSKPNPLPELLEDLTQQNTLKPDFYTLPCNTAHYFYEDLQAAANVPILHMPREAVKEIKTKYPKAKRVGIVATKGTIADHIYDDEIMAAGYEFVRPTQEIQDQTNELIFDDIKDQNIVDRALFHGFVQKMFEEQNCDVVILGCTELSLAQEREPIEKIDIIDAQSVLVDRTLELALKDQK
ncbi:aspartate/glutamate racemase family protein [Secundilactobacillus malefermentans]|uniref:aspartate/glutamate racemase family protein n=1 Tax=Secundilactobacillus malefermentans TaxID=176292 RepID=UPI0011CA6BCF|nr:amino acid racemase [Secundilactobacillus malefermentans]QEA30759.1 amino acid racemase [Secundilactobacillus malefermentans]